MSTIPERLSVLEKGTERVDEFMLRTDKRLEEIIASQEEAAKSHAETTKQLDEWRTIRKTLAWVGAGIMSFGGMIGWWLHYMWPGVFGTGGHG